MVERMHNISNTPNEDANPPVQELSAIQKASGTFQINNAKLYVPVTVLSINDNIKCL